MRLPKNPNITIAVLFIYTTCMYIYLFPRNNEMSNTEKWLIVAVSYIVLAVLWFMLKRRNRLRRERENDTQNNSQEK